MDKIVAIILALLVAIVGFLVIQHIVEGNNNLPDPTASGVECRAIYFGSCVETCDGSPVPDADCGGGTICCVGE